MEQRAVSGSRLRIAIGLLIVACLLYFICGGIAVYLRWFAPDRYVGIGGVVGGVASVLGLLALARRSLNQDDLAGLELESLRRIADTSEQVKQLELARAETLEEIGTLETRKRQMEFLVQKASLVLFLQEQHRLYEKRVQDELAQNKGLMDSISELVSIEQKLAALEEEIARDPNVPNAELLERVIEAARSRAKSEIALTIDSPFGLIIRNLKLILGSR
jgi:hypothetical protein